MPIVQPSVATDMLSRSSFSRAGRRSGAHGGGTTVRVGGAPLAPLRRGTSRLVLGKTNAGGYRVGLPTGPWVAPTTAPTHSYVIADI
jgi:hypothetical protein